MPKFENIEHIKADASNTGCSVTGGDCDGLHFVDPELGRYMHITTRGDHLDEGTPMRFMSASLKMDQGLCPRLSTVVVTF